MNTFGLFHVVLMSSLLYSYAEQLMRYEKGSRGISPKEESTKGESPFENLRWEVWQLKEVVNENSEKLQQWSSSSSTSSTSTGEDLGVSLERRITLLEQSVEGRFLEMENRLSLQISNRYDEL